MIPANISKDAEIRILRAKGSYPERIYYGI